MYILNDIPFTVITDEMLSVEFETIVVEITTGARRVIVSEIYRVPNTNENVATERYDEFVRSVNKWSDVIIATLSSVLTTFNCFLPSRGCFAIWVRLGEIYRWP